MKLIIDLAKEKNSDARDLFNRDNLFKHIEIKNFDCSTLSSPIDTDGKKLPQHIIDNFFAILHQYDQNEIPINSCPCIYIIELEKKSDRERVLMAFKEIRKKGIDRKLPSLKKNIPNSKYLYVGKAETDVGKRLVTHLGYYQSSGNHGLQLAFWAKNLEPSLKINVHILRFIKSYKPYLSSMEVSLAKELKPIIGKHK